MMKNREAVDRRFVILVDSGSESRHSVSTWLTSHGYLSCETSDLVDAIEELSDFTAGERPDFVVVDVPATPVNFPSFQQALWSTCGNNEITVLGYSEASTADKQPHLATSLKQLKTILNREIACPGP